MEYKEFTVTQYADTLESTGRLALGEPSVHYQIKSGKEHVRFYLDFENHGTQAVLAEGNLCQPESSVRKSIFQDGVSSKNYSLNEFVKVFENRNLYAEKLNNLQIEGHPILGKASATKYLTLFLARQILEKDSFNSTDNFNKVLALESIRDILRKTYNAIGRPEHLAYISRLSYFDKNQKIEFIDLPFEYMERSFKPPVSYKEITIPYLSREESKALPYLRNQVKVSA